MSDGPRTPFEEGLDRRPANHSALTPLDFIAWSGEVFEDRAGVIYGDRVFRWGETYERCRRLASGLAELGVKRGDTVAVMCPNTPPMLEAHFGVPMAGAVLNAINTRLDPATIGFILAHGRAKVLLTDTEFAPVIDQALAGLASRPRVVDICDPVALGERLGETDYESLLAAGDPDFRPLFPKDEWDAISLSYTSGTTGDPKGVVYHHRGACLNALGNALQFRLHQSSIYLWTLPMFHCNGWSCAWGVTAVGGTHVCLRKTDPALVFEAIDRHRVSHLCAAPVVLGMLIHAPETAKRRFAHSVDVVTGGAAPPSAVITAMEAMGFRVTHAYGLTETYGPATLCTPQADWAGLSQDERAMKMARQGVRYPTLAEARVGDPETLVPVPADGEAVGEILVRGNTVMKGYLDNPRATEEAFRGDWYHTGDLGVVHPDGYIEVKDRAKDIIISGGENISSLEVEETLYRHPMVTEAAVVAMPDARWGERPCAFVALKEGAAVEANEIIAWCRERLARFKAPSHVVFTELPKTSTGKIQKFELRARARQLVEGDKDRGG